MKAPLVQHHELGLAAGGFVGGPLHLTVLSRRHVRGDVEGIAKLMRRHDRRHMFEVSQLHDLVVNRNRRDRIKARRRIVEEQQGRPGGHRPRKADTPALASGEFRRHPADELAKADEPEDFLDTTLDVGGRHVRFLGQPVADVLGDRE